VVKNCSSGKVILTLLFKEFLDILPEILITINIFKQFTKTLFRVRVGDYWVYFRTRYREGV